MYIFIERERKNMITLVSFSEGTVGRQEQERECFWEWKIKKYITSMYEDNLTQCTVLVE
jgi:hypothetical protein